MKARTKHLLKEIIADFESLPKGVNLDPRSRARLEYARKALKGDKKGADALACDIMRDFIEDCGMMPPKATKIIDVWAQANLPKGAQEVRKDNHELYWLLTLKESN